MNIQYVDGHEGIAQPLFASTDGDPAGGDGNWVQLSPATADAESLGYHRQSVESSGGTLLAVVPEALLWSQPPPAGERWLHLDCRSDQFVLTVLEGGDRLAIVRTAVDNTTSLRDLEKRIRLGVAEHSVRETRYDPLHNGAAEKQLNKQLSAHMPNLLAGSEVQLSLADQRLTITPRQLQGWCQSAWTKLIPILRRESTSDAAILLSPAAAKLPNLESALTAALGTAVSTIDAAASRDRQRLDAWLASDLPGHGCWLLQTRPREV